MPDADTYRFGPFRLMPSRRQLLEEGAPVQLGARAFDLLIALVEGRDRVLTKDELMRRVWPDSAVEDNNLTVNISALRKALQDRPNDQRYIRTVSGRGYRFVGEVQQEDAALGADAISAETPSIAVLPFANLGNDPDAEQFADGIAEDIISELSRNRWLTVIARNSSFSFRNQPLDVPGIARKLGVRYLLDGSIRKAGTCVRVSTHLMDATTNSEIVAERFDRELADFFAVQDEITALIANSVRPALYEVEQERSMRRHPDSLDAWAAYQRGVWHFSRFEEPESAEARRWFERSIALDPRYAPGHYGLGLLMIHDGSGYMHWAPPDWQKQGEQLALKAVSLDGRDSGGYSVLAVARMVRGDHEGALTAAVQSLALNPSDSVAHGTMGASLVFNGRPLEGLESLATCLRLNPRDPRLRVRYAHMALGHFFAGHHEQAEAIGLDIVHRWPSFSFGPRLLAMVYGETGRVEEGRAAIAAAMALSPAPFDDFSHARMPWYGATAHRRALAALRSAGFTGRAD